MNVLSMESVGKYGDSMGRIATRKSRLGPMIPRSSVLEISELSYPREEHSPIQKDSRMDFEGIEVEKNDTVHEVVMSPTLANFVPTKGESGFDVVSNNEKISELEDETRRLREEAKRLEHEEAKRKLEETRRRVAEDARIREEARRETEARIREEIARETEANERARARARQQSPRDEYIESVRKKARDYNTHVPDPFKPSPAEIERQRQARAQQSSSQESLGHQQSHGRSQEIVDPLLHAHAVPYVVGSDSMPNYDSLPHEQQEQLKLKFWTKIEILIEQGRINRTQIPEAHASLPTLHKFYNDEIKRIKVKSGLSKWKIGLSIVILVLEGCMNKFSSFNMTGFGEFQMQQFSDQDQLLIELGEKYISTGAEAATPESKLAWALMFNAIVFCAIKVLSTMTFFDVKSVMKMISELIGTKFGIAALEQTPKDEFEPEDIPDNKNEEQIGGMLGSIGSMMGVDINGVETATKLGTILTKKFQESKEADMKKAAKASAKAAARAAEPKKKKITVAV